MNNDTNEKDLQPTPNITEASAVPSQNEVGVKEEAAVPTDSPHKLVAPKKKRLTQILLILCVCVAVASIAYIVFYAYQYFTHQKLSNNLKNMYADTIADTSDSVSQTPLPTAANATPSGNDAPVKEYTEHELLLLAEEQGLKRFDNFLKINSDFRGVILIEGLGIELPYVHYSDNVKYLDKSFEGKTSEYGTVFLSSDNDRLLTDKNNVLFGHHITNGKMFAPLLKYRTIENVAKAPTIVLDDVTGRSEWLVFAAYVCEPDYGYINTKVQGEAYTDLLEEINSRSLFHTNVDVNENDQIVTLSTCTYEFQDARFAVHARKLRVGEEVPELTVEKNPSPKQANVPKQMKLSAVKANRTAIMQHPNSLKTYYYQAVEGGIEWYVGNTSQVQGAYSSFVGKLAADSSISAACAPSDAAGVLAVDRLNGSKGISILRSRLPSGTYKQIGKKPVTPQDVDARYPLLTVNGQELWLLYAVEGEQDEQIYRIKIETINASNVTYGEPQCVRTMPKGSGIRPIGMTVIDGNTLLTWHEASTLQLFSAWLESPEPMLLSYSGDADRITIYGKLTDGKLRMMTEKGGKFSPGSFDTGLIPRLEQPTVEEPVIEEPPVSEEASQDDAAVEEASQDDAVVENTDAPSVEAEAPVTEEPIVTEGSPVEDIVSP